MFYVPIIHVEWYSGPSIADSIFNKQHNFSTDFILIFHIYIYI